MTLARWRLKGLPAVFENPSNSSSGWVKVRGMAFQNQSGTFLEREGGYLNLDVTSWIVNISATMLVPSRRQLRECPDVETDIT